MTVRALPRSLEDLRGRRAARWIRESTAGRRAGRARCAARAAEPCYRALGPRRHRRCLAGRALGADDRGHRSVGGDARRRRRGLGGPRRRRRVPVCPRPADRGQRPSRPPCPGRRILFADERVLTPTRTSGSAGPAKRSRPRRTADGSRSGPGRATPRSAGGSASRAATRAPFGTVREGARSTVDEASTGRRPPRVRTRVGRPALIARSARRRASPSSTSPRCSPTRSTSGRWVGRAVRPRALVDPVTWEHVQVAPRAVQPQAPRVVHPPASTDSRACWPARRAAVASPGMSGRYRHTDACEAFRVRAPRRVQRRRERPIDPRVRGESYKVDVYEGVIGRAFEHVAVSARAQDRHGGARDGNGPTAPTRWHWRAIKPGARAGGAAVCEGPRPGPTRGVDGETRRGGAGGGVPPVTHPTAAEARAYLEIAAGPVGEDLGRGTTDDRGGRVRTDRRPGGDRLSRSP